MIRINIEDNLIDGEERNTMYINKELGKFLETNEGQNIKADIETLSIMGFDKKMINKVYILFRPENIERGIDYMTEINGIYQHNFIANNNLKQKTLCFICRKTKRFHLDYILEDLLNEEPNFNQNNNNQDIIDNDSNIFDKHNNNDECQVCYEVIDKENKDLNKIPCGHLFCIICWFNYLKSLILESKVDDIKCMEHECKAHVSDEFILKHISNNENLVEKYNKFKKRAEIISDKNKKICPKADCDSFLSKSKTSKYVKCENGHEYCFECLKAPHGKKSCDYEIENQFMIWKKGKRVKRCPRCQMYTEKNEGCNHMTCASCKYQWCWLCEGEYKYEHYKSGRCKGQQFTRADNLKDIEKYRHAFGLHKIFRCIYPEVNGPFDLDEYLWAKYLAILGFLPFGYGVLYVYVVIFYLEKNTNFIEGRNENFFIVMTCLIGLVLFVSYQIIFTCTVAPFILVAFIYHRFFDRILLFYGIGENENL